MSGYDAPTAYVTPVYVAPAYVAPAYVAPKQVSKDLTAIFEKAA